MSKISSIAVEKDMALCNKKDLQQKSVGVFFGHTARLLETYMINLLRPFGIGLEQLWVLHILHSMDKEVRVSDLAQALLKDITTTSRLLSTLERKGFVSKYKEPRDKRVAYLHITQAGLQKLEEISFLKDKMDIIFDTALSEQDQVLLRSLLEKIEKVALQ